MAPTSPSAAPAPAPLRPAPPLPKGPPQEARWADAAGTCGCLGGRRGRGSQNVRERGAGVTSGGWLSLRLRNSGCRRTVSAPSSSWLSGVLHHLPLHLFRGSTFHVRAPPPRARIDLPCSKHMPYRLRLWARDAMSGKQTPATLPSSTPAAAVRARDEVCIVGISIRHSAHVGTE